MGEYRKKPVVIEAVQWAAHADAEADTGYVFDAPTLPDWLLAALSSDVTINEDGTLRVSTLEGEYIASPGDWIIRGVKGELYPCKPDIFDATYEPAEQPA